MWMFAFATLCWADAPPEADPALEWARHGQCDLRNLIGGIPCRQSDLLSLPVVRTTVNVGPKTLAAVALRNSEMARARIRIQEALDKDISRATGNEDFEKLFKEVAAIFGPELDQSVLETLDAEQSASLLRCWAQLLGPGLAAQAPAFKPRWKPTLRAAEAMGAILHDRLEAPLSMARTDRELARFKFAQERLLELGFEPAERNAWKKLVGTPVLWTPADLAAVEAANGAGILRLYPALQRNLERQLTCYLKVEPFRTELKRFGADPEKLLAVAADLDAAEVPRLKLAGLLETAGQHATMRRLRIQWLRIADAAVADDPRIPKKALERLRQLRCQHSGILGLFRLGYADQLGITDQQRKELGPALEKAMANWKGPMPFCSDDVAVVMMGLLTPEQKKRFPTLMGEPFPPEHYAYINALLRNIVAD